MWCGLSRNATHRPAKPEENVCQSIGSRRIEKEGRQGIHMKRLRRVVVRQEEEGARHAAEDAVAVGNREELAQPQECVARKGVREDHGQGRYGGHGGPDDEGEMGSEGDRVQGRTCRVNPERFGSSSQQPPSHFPQTFANHVSDCARLLFFPQRCNRNPRKRLTQIVGGRDLHRSSVPDKKVARTRGERRGSMLSRCSQSRGVSGVFQPRSVEKAARKMPVDMTADRTSGGAMGDLP